MVNSIKRRYCTPDTEFTRYDYLHRMLLDIVSLSIKRFLEWLLISSNEKLLTYNTACVFNFIFYCLTHKNEFSFTK